MFVLYFVVVPLWRIHRAKAMTAGPTCTSSRSSYTDLSDSSLSLRLRLGPGIVLPPTMSRRAPKGEYIETDTGNKVARRAVLVGTQNIMLGGKTVIQPEVMIRGDLSRTAPSSSSSSSGNASAPASNTAVAIGRYCFLARGALLRPPGRMYKGSFTYMPLRMGDHVFVGQGTVVQAATVGNHVQIGKACTIGEFAIVKDYVKILDGTVVPPNMVIPSFSVVAGQPARVVGEIPEGGHDEFELRDLYKTVGNNPQPPAS